MSRVLTVAAESWPLARAFTISRGAKTAADVVAVAIRQGGATGRGECVPYPRYGESVETVCALIEELRPRIENGLTREALQDALPAGAARSAVDCAFWDLEAKLTGVPVWRRAGLQAPVPAVTAYTISLDAPERMAEDARASGRPLLKLKLGGDGDPERLAAVRAAVPEARLLVDANEGWSEDTLDEYMDAAAAARVELVEQPLPQGADGALVRWRDGPVPLCADESVHTAADIPDLAKRYRLVNVKLDKTGGLTGALDLVRAAREHGLGVFVGCMVGTSLAMAPAALLAAEARVVDLDGPLLLARDRDPGLRYDGATLHPPETGLWG